MSMAQANLYERYQSNQVLTSNTGELLLLLYDRAVQLTRQAERMIAAGKAAEAHQPIMGTERILAELTATLNYDAGEVAGQLRLLYDYMTARLVQANIKKDRLILTEVGGMLSELRDTWRQIIRECRK